MEAAVRLGGWVWWDACGNLCLKGHGKRPRDGVWWFLMGEKSGASMRFSSSRGIEDTTFQLRDDALAACSYIIKKAACPPPQRQMARSHNLATGCFQRGLGRYIHKRSLTRMGDGALLLFFLNRGFGEGSGRLLSWSTCTYLFLVHFVLSSHCKVDLTVLL
jgi:hypothetical protein